jgi:cell division protein FtsB
MRLLRYIFVPWVIFLVYFFFTAILGQNGLYARKHLEAERYELAENHRALVNTGSDLYKTKENLIHDHDTLSVYARQLGYGRRNEEFIRIMGLGIAINDDMSSGQVLYAGNPEFVSDKIIKIISVIAGFVVLVFFLIMDFFPFKARE